MNHPIDTCEYKTERMKKKRFISCQLIRTIYSDYPLQGIINFGLSQRFSQSTDKRWKGTKKKTIVSQSDFHQKMSRIRSNKIHIKTHKIIYVPHLIFCVFIYRMETWKFYNTNAECNSPVVIWALHKSHGFIFSYSGITKCRGTLKTSDLCRCKMA